MLRELVERGMRLPMPGQVEGGAGAVSAAGEENVLVAFKREAEAAVRKHAKGKGKNGRWSK